MSSEEKSVDEFLDRFSQQWAAKGGAALGDYFTEDGTLINPFGERADGRDAVAAMYGEYFQTMLRSTTTSIKVDAVRVVGADHSFIDGEQTIVGPAGEVVMTVHLSALLRRTADGWRFVDSRPFTVAAQ